MPIESHISTFLTDNFRRPALTFTPSGKPRVQYIDLAKGICILMVVWIHCFIHTPYDCPPILTHLRLPLYFTLSGMFFKDYGSIFTLVEKKFNRLIVPFLTFGIIGAIINSVMNGGNLLGFGPVRFFYHGPIGNLPLWFLLSLFWCNLIYCLITLKLRSEILRLIAVLLCAFAGFRMFDCKIEVLPRLHAALLAMPMFVFGSYLRGSFLLDKSIGNEKICIGGILLMCIGVIFYISGDNLDEDWFGCACSGAWPSFYIIPFFLVTGLLMICRGIGGWLPVISYVGRYSIIILALHNIYLGYAYLPFYFFGIELGHFPRFFLTLSLSWLSIPVLVKWVPGLVAQKEWVRLPRIENLRKMVRAAK